MGIATDMDPYRDYVSTLARLYREGAAFPLGGMDRLPLEPVAPDALRAVIFSPHPDDECIVGGLALRMRREAGVRVVNLAVTQGSNPARREARWEELRAACGFLGFELVAPRPGGLERINVETRETDAGHWSAAVHAVADVVEEHRPSIVFLPHEGDWNSTHVGTHHLALEALARQPADFACTVVETEFWGAMGTPNLMVESSEDDVAALMAALSFHVGEVQRNPYHLRLPAWMMDNVRRGAEIVGGQGGAAPDFTFATLYRVRAWNGGRLLPPAPRRSLAASETAALPAPE